MRRVLSSLDPIANIPGIPGKVASKSKRRDDKYKLLPAPDVQHAEYRIC